MISVGYGLTQFNRGHQIGGIDGIGNYSYELFKKLQKHPSIELYPFSFGYQFTSESNNGNSTVLDRLRTHLIKSTVNPFGKLNMLNNFKVDLIHATDHLIPITNKIPVVATIMDAIPLSNPEWVAGQGTYFTKFKYNVWKRTVKRANSIITVSEYSKKQIAEYFEIDANIINVVPLAVDNRFYERIPNEEKTRVLKELNLPTSGFFLNVGTMQPRKNVLLILEAMQQLSAEFRKQFPLVLVGRIGWGSEDTEAAIVNAVNQGWCYWLKRIPDFEMRCLLQSTNALLFPSLSEGFGLPVLEAFASETPVITSNTTSLPEVGGDAALYIDPSDANDLAKNIYSIVNSDISDQLILKGLQRSRDFTWDKCANQTVKIYNKIIRAS